jgi:hypothetical protein
MACRIPTVYISFLESVYIKDYVNNAKYENSFFNENMIKQKLDFDTNIADYYLVYGRA